MSLATFILTKLHGGYRGGGGGAPPPTGDVSPMLLSLNIGETLYYDAMPVFVDLLRQGPGIYNSAGTALAAVDASGWPNEDFLTGLQRLPPDSPFSQSVTVLVDGNPGTVSLGIANYWTLGATTYDAGTDTATIQLTSPPHFGNRLEGCQLRFTGTKKTPASPVGSGVRRVRIPRPGYASNPDQLVSDEYRAIVGGFSCIRFMKAQRVEVFADVVSWNDVPSRNKQGGRSFGDEANGRMPIEDIIAISNELHVHPWICIYGSADAALGTASMDYKLAQYVEANLDPSLFCIYEHINETWNFGYQWTWTGIDKACAELHGFWHDVYSRAGKVALSMSRTSNVVTIGLNYAHGMTVPQTYQCSFQGRTGTGAVTATPTDATHFQIPDTGADCKFVPTLGGTYNDNTQDIGGRRLSGVVTAFSTASHLLTTGDTVYVPLNGLTSSTKLFTVTVTDATHFTFSDPGPDGDLALTSGNNSWGGSISTGSPLTFEGDASPSQYLAEKYWMRRRAQMSDLIRAAVPADKFMTRHRPVFMSQWASGTINRYYDGKAMLESGLGTTYKAKFWALGGGAYPDSTLNDGSRPSLDYSRAISVDEWIAIYTESATTGMGEPFFNPDIFSSFAFSEGVQNIGYEIGVDTKLYGNGPFRAANAVTLRQATLDPRWKAVERAMPEVLVQDGVAMCTLFNGEMTAKDDYSGGGYWSLSWGILSASPKQQAFIEWRANPPAMVRNLAPGTVDARCPVWFYPWRNGGENFGWDGHYYPTMRAPFAASPMPADRLRYIINATEGRTMTLSIGYKTLRAVNHTIGILANGVNLGNVSLPSVGINGLGTSTTISVPLAYGPNGVDLIRDNSNDDFEVISLDFA